MQDLETVLDSLLQNLKQEFEATNYENDRHNYFLLETLDVILGGNEEKNNHSFSHGLESISEKIEDLLREYQEYYNQFYETEHYINNANKKLLWVLSETVQNHLENNKRTIKKLYPRANKQLEKLKLNYPTNLDILSNMEKLRNENAHSDIISGLLDSDKCPNISSIFLFNIIKASLYHSKRLRDRMANEIHLGRSKYNFLESFCESLEKNKIHIRSLREYPVSNGMRIDILIKTKEVFIAIENKVGTLEHDNQTVEYYNWLISKCDYQILPYGIMLSPHKLPPACPDFAILDYEDIKWSLVKALCQRKINESEVVYAMSYINSLEKLKGDV